MFEALLLVLLCRNGGGFVSLRGVGGGPGSWYFDLLKFDGEGCKGRKVRSFCRIHGELYDRHNG